LLGFERVWITAEKSGYFDVFPGLYNEEENMLSFESDYIEGAHEEILKRLVETNREQLTGYGADHYCDDAKAKIREACQCPDAEIFFLVGGTQTNQTVIDTMLKPYEGVVAAETGHVSLHEAGAIEFCGHKVLEVPGHEGKIHAKELETLLENFWQDDNHEHMVFPGMVYISHPTEYGTLYSRRELEEISAVCRNYKIPLYLDGARLGYGLMSLETDVTLPMVAEYCDVFYIGGTKVGALCGEAVVFTKKNMPRYFMTMVKQHGALLAKGRLLGIQFDTLFTDDLYFKISRHAIEMAEILKKGLKEKGKTFYLESPTNQQFVILDNREMERLQEKVAFGFWEKADDEHTVVRFATSWATRKEDVETLMDLL
jgi:threonine aldolase